jgi:hypothetical protein
MSDPTLVVVSAARLMVEPAEEEIVLAPTLTLDDGTPLTLDDSTPLTLDFG